MLCGSFELFNGSRLRGFIAAAAGLFQNGVIYELFIFMHFIMYLCILLLL